MPSLKEFRNRITSVKSTQKITKAMQMVAAAKLKRAQSAAEAARPYANRMARVIANLASSVKGDSAPKLLGGTGKDETHLIVVASSERGPLRRLQHADRALGARAYQCAGGAGKDRENSRRRQEGPRSAAPHPRRPDRRLHRSLGVPECRRRRRADRRRENLLAVTKRASSMSRRLCSRNSNR